MSKSNGVTQKQSKTKKSSSLWGGRFAESPAELLQKYSESVSFDWRLYQHDIRGSIAHAKMLQKIKILTQGEFLAIQKGLLQIEKEITAGKFSWCVDREDVHMNIEATLTSRVPAGAKLHTSRSRNDQVATDVRLWLRDEINQNIAAIRALQRTLVLWAERDVKVIIPGFTHLQRAQPVLLAHHLLAYVEMLDRDAGRLLDAQKRMNVLPLGSGAIAGSTIPLDRDFVAKELGFEGITRNSMDGVSDRDFVVEYLSGVALCGVHLSRLSEDLILWSSAEFGWIRLSDAFTTGSSLMPQKKNPDVAELCRGKSGRLVGNLVSVLVLLKGLPMTYNRDLQEDKERLFDSADTIQLSLEIMSAMLHKVEVREKICRAAASDPLLLATDVADYLVNKGVPFRHAHEIVGRAVALAEKLDTPLDKLDLSEWKNLSPHFEKGIKDVFHLESALKGRPMKGSPNPQRVQEEIRRWKKVLN
ncbi:MAG: argininosuccinate lyase [Verrucomicrobiota bacterium]